MDENWEDDDGARLQNIVHFLEYIDPALSSIDPVSWMRPEKKRMPGRGPSGA